MTAANGGPRPRASARLLSILRTLGFRHSVSKGGPVPRSGERVALGAWGEKQAERALRRRGYRTLLRNAAAPAGEADLVMRAPDGRTVVIVEVKARWETDRPGPRPESGITRTKARRLVAVARQLARRHGWGSLPIRIDVVAVERPRDGRPPVIRHHERAVTADRGGSVR